MRRRGTDLWRSSNDPHRRSTVQDPLAITLLHAEIPTRPIHRRLTSTRSCRETIRRPQNRRYDQFCFLSDGERTHLQDWSNGGVIDLRVGSRGRRDGWQGGTECMRWLPSPCPRETRKRSICRRFEFFDRCSTSKWRGVRIRRGPGDVEWR